MGYPVAYRRQASDYPARRGVQTPRSNPQPRPANDNNGPGKPANDNKPRSVFPKLNAQERKLFEFGAKFMLRKNPYYKAYKVLEHFYDALKFYDELEKPYRQFPARLRRTDHAAGVWCGAKGDMMFGSSSLTCGTMPSGTLEVWGQTDGRWGRMQEGPTYFIWNEYNVKPRPSDLRYYDCYLQGRGKVDKLFPSGNWPLVVHNEDQGEMSFHFPWLDPWNMPIQKPTPLPRPAPWRNIPFREDSPWRETGPKPLSQPSPRRSPEWLRVSDGQTGPSIEWNLSDRHGKPVVQAPVFVPRRPPKDGELEKKAFIALDKKSLGMRIVSMVTETGDVIEAIYEAIPEEIRGKRKRSMVNQVKAIVENWHSIPVEKAIENLIKNEIEDRLYGKAGKQLAKYAREQRLGRGLQIGKAL